MTKRVLYLSGTRADYGLVRPVLSAIRESGDLSVEVAATGLHLMEEFGLTVQEILDDEFTVHRVPATYRKDTRESMATFVGECTTLLVPLVQEVRPDILLLLGDRGEMLAGAIVGSYLSIPMVHIHGGEITSTVDEHVRHAITKLAHVHCAATARSAERIIRMGEDPARVFVTGAPGLDSILREPLPGREEVARVFDLDPKEPVLLVIQHPVTQEYREAAAQMEETMEGVASLGMQTVVVYPNADASGRAMISVIRSYGHLPFLRVRPSIPRRQFLGLLASTSVLVGNSSTGIIEAPALQVPAVNIGSRQAGRERGGNVLDTDYRRDAIRDAVTRALSDRAFREQVARGTSPYGDGKAAERIVTVLRSLDPGKVSLQKRLTY